MMSRRYERTCQQCGKVWTWQEWQDESSEHRRVMGHHTHGFGCGGEVKTKLLEECEVTVKMDEAKHG